MRILRWLKRAGGYGVALRHRDLRLLLGAQAVSMTGSWAYTVALLAYIFDRTHSLAWVGAASTLRVLPGFVLSPYGGVLAERFERRRVMVVSDLLGGACQAGLCAVALLGGSAAWAIALAVLTMASTCAYDPAVTATVPGVVTESDLPAANALVQTVENLVLIAGPALGAVLLAVLSPSAVFAVNAGSFLGGALLVSRIGVRSTPVDVTEGGTAGLRAQLAVGVRAITGSRRAATLVAGVALTSFLYGTDTVQLVGVATERLGTGARGFGWLLAAMGVGGVLIAPAVEQVSRLNRLVPVITGGIVAMGLPTLLLLAVRQPVAAAALEACRGAGMLVVDTLAMIALQRSVPADRLARVCGVLWAIAIGAITLGAAIASPVIDAVGLAGSLWLFGTAPIALVVLALPALRGLDREAAAHVAELEPRIAALAGTSVFAVADRALLERLAEGAREIEVPQGEAIITDPRRRGDLRRDRPDRAAPARCDGHGAVVAARAAGRRRALPGGAQR
jgi:MFS family permease